jgi:arylsulfatase A-like enzyme/predicted Zn-dependent protease
MRKAAVILVLLVFAIPGVLLMTGCTSGSKPKVRNILLISIDTCRADHLSCYGYPRHTTPHIDQLAAEGILFEKVVTPVPMTLPAHSSMLCGTNPPYHGVHTNLEYHLGPSNVTLPELLREQGMVTGAIISSFVLDARFGLNQGFDSYDDQFDETHSVGHINERKGGEATTKALAWLDEHENAPFFLFLHYFDPHDPYQPPPPFDDRFAGDPYAGEIAFVDQCVGQVIDRLKQLGLYESTLIIVTGDHGEMLGEHGETTHSYFVYQGAIRVPLIFKVPGLRQPKRIRDLVGLVDVVPTVCGLLGVDAPPAVVGEDLSPCFGSGKFSTKERFRYCESFTPGSYAANVLLAVTQGDWKYIQTTVPELYDLSEDPKELHNRVDDRVERVLEMQAALAGVLNQELRPDAGSALAVDEEARGRLESIGYVAGGEVRKAASAYDYASDLDDPKDLLQFYNAHAKASEALARDDLEQASRLYQRLVDERPGFLAGHLNLARIVREQGDETASIPHLLRALEINPDHSGSHNNLALAYQLQNNLPKACEHFQRAIETTPFVAEQAKLHGNLADASIRQGKFQQSLAHYQQALDLKSGYTRAQFGVARTHFLMGQTDEAISQYRALLEMDRQYPGARNALASLLDSQGDFTAAVAEYRKSIEQNPRDLEAVNNLAWLLAACPDAAVRKPTEAIQLALQAVDHATAASPVLWDTLATAHASAGDFKAAVKTANEALQLAEESEAKELATEIRQRLELYENHQPYLGP